ncbi:acyl-CoA synthetase [Cumulibacter manganitolerans]|uniref:acyl-CoA synthetase n=1 Tax=Cumulibacter manganitolerans TaxID=1884992 RepID=UPI0012950D0E|nr:acyl-CoA synthetase [Cumulibacter manganitolerans]
MYPGAYVNSTPDKPAIIMAGSGAQLTYRELEEQSAKLARALHDLGLRKGDVIAMLSDNQAECFVIYWAALRSGLYITAINFHLTAEEAAYIVADCEAKVLFASGSIAPLALDVAAQSPAVGHHFAFAGDIAGFASMSELIAGAGEPLAEMPSGADMLYSSGTTGRPKGIKAALPDRTIDEPGNQLVALATTYFGMSSDSVYLSPAPVYHAAPLRWSATVQAIGGTVVMLERFDAQAMLEAIEKYRITATQVVPTMFVRMLQLPAEVRETYDHSSLRLCIHAAAPCPPEVKAKMIDWWGPVLVEYYASTEGAGMTIVTSEDWLHKPGTVGRAALGIIRICDDEGTELPTGEAGMVYFERDEPTFEYHNAPEKTSESRHPRHPEWTTVGDIGYVDEDGYLFLTDRKAFMIISGGVNIYPQEVENVLALHPAVYDVAVIGVPDDEMGQQVKAVVQLRDGVQPSDELAAEIIDYVRARIARFKAPRSVDFIDELPRTPTGKLVKGKLRELYAPQR